MGTLDFQELQGWAPAQEAPDSLLSCSERCPQETRCKPTLLTPKQLEGVPEPLPAVPACGPGATSRSAPRATPSEAPPAPLQRLQQYSCSLELHNCEASGLQAGMLWFPAKISPQAHSLLPPPHSLPFSPLPLVGPTGQLQELPPSKNTPHPAAHARPLDITPRSPPEAVHLCGDEALMGMGKVQRTEGHRCLPESRSSPPPPHPLPFPASTVGG